MSNLLFKNNEEITLDLFMLYKTFDGKDLRIKYLKYTPLVYDVNSFVEGDSVGYISLLYHFASREINVSLEVYSKLNSDFNWELMFKIPFVDQLELLNNVLFEKELDEYHHTYVPNDSFEVVEHCSCGGVVLPMYEEFPNWIKFCTKCKITSEDLEQYPLPF